MMKTQFEVNDLTGEEMYQVTMGKWGITIHTKHVEEIAVVAIQMEQDRRMKEGLEA